MIGEKRKTRQDSKTELEALIKQMKLEKGLETCKWCLTHDTIPDDCCVCIEMTDRELFEWCQLDQEEARDYDWKNYWTRERVELLRKDFGMTGELFNKEEYIRKCDIREQERKARKERRRKYKQNKRQPIKIHQ
jgi:hypothetical protein